MHHQRTYCQFALKPRKLHSFGASDLLIPAKRSSPVPFLFDPESSYFLNWESSTLVSSSTSNIQTGTLEVSSFAALWFWRMIRQLWSLEPTLYCLSSYQLYSAYRTTPWRRTFLPYQESSNVSPLAHNTMDVHIFQHSTILQWFKLIIATYWIRTVGRIYGVLWLHFPSGNVYTSKSKLQRFSVQLCSPISVDKGKLCCRLIIAAFFDKKANENPLAWIWHERIDNTVTVHWSQKWLSWTILNFGGSNCNFGPRAGKMITIGLNVFYLNYFNQQSRPWSSDVNASQPCNAFTTFPLYQKSFDILKCSCDVEKMNTLIGQALDFICSWFAYFMASKTCRSSPRIQFHDPSYKPVNGSFKKWMLYISLDKAKNKILSNFSESPTMERSSDDND